LSQSHERLAASSASLHRDSHDICHDGAAVCSEWRSRRGSDEFIAADCVLVCLGPPRHLCPEAGCCESADEAGRTSQSQIETLYHAGHASWLERAQSQLDLSAAQTNQESQERLAEWLSEQVEQARTSCRVMDLVSVLARLPDSQIPIAWRSIDEANEGIEGIILPSSTSADLQRATLRADRLREHFEAVRSSSSSNPKALYVAELQQQAATAELALIQSVLALDEFNDRAIRIVLKVANSSSANGAPYTPDRDGSGRNICGQLITLISAESKICADAELNAVYAWSKSNAESTRALQQTGLASVRELASRQRDEFQLAGAMAAQTELSDWKRARLAKHSEGLATTEPIASSLDDSLPALNKITDLPVFDFVVTSVGISLDLKQQRILAQRRLELSDELLSRLQSQSNASKTEVGNTQKLRSLHAAQLELITKRAELAKDLVSILPDLCNSKQRGDCVELLNEDFLAALCRFEAFQSTRAISDIAGIDRTIKSARQRLDSLEQLRQQRLASAAEISSLSDQLLQLESEKVRISQKSRHHLQRQNLLLDLHPELGSHP
jgi:hypothetical protein